MVNIIIDGNIGCGKTTLLNKIKLNFPNNPVFLEDVKIFKPWLKLFYKNMGKYALGFQMEVLLSHMKISKDNDFLEGNFILERSPLSCLNVFGKYFIFNN